MECVTDVFFAPFYDGMYVPMRITIGEWPNYSKGIYQFRVDMIDADTGEYVESRNNETDSSLDGVRLEWPSQDVAAEAKYTISLSAVPGDGGSVSGGGTYESGSTRTVRATPNSGFAFVNWMENGAAASTSPNYTFTLTSARTLIAHFTHAASPGTICLAAASCRVVEGSKLKIRVKRLNGSDGIASVNYLTKQKTALPWVDFMPKIGSLTWGDGDAGEKTVKIPIRADGQQEGDEVFFIILKSPIGAALSAPNRTRICIVSNVKSGPVSDEPVAERMQKLTEALDEPNLTWVTSAKAPWVAQPFVTRDEQDAAVSCETSSEPISWIQTDLDGPGILEFDWLLKGTGESACLILVNGKVRRLLTPRYDWSHEVLQLGKGDHTLRWVFVGANRIMSGAAYLDQVKWNAD
jgi:hypothetical protein